MPRKRSSNTSTTDEQAVKERLDRFISKQRVHMYKPIQVAEILYRVRRGEFSSKDLDNRENYRNLSKRWRDEVTRKLVGSVCTSSQKFQDNLFEENAVPPWFLKQLAAINYRHGGLVERYIYQQFAKRLKVIFEARAYLHTRPEEFSIEKFFAYFEDKKVLRRSVDKAYEIAVYALFNAVLDQLRVSVEIAVDPRSLSKYPEFASLTSLLLGLSESTPRRSMSARLFRSGIANAADCGVDMWANFGPIVQVKHVTLSMEIAEDVAESTTAEEIVIVCRDSEADILQSVASQLGRRIRGIIRESELKLWYQTAFSPKYAATLGLRTLSYLQREFDSEFPFCNPTYSENFRSFYKERGYDQLQKPSAESPFYEPDE
ncbi:MAG: HaeII family restriction endonuclease [Fimbriimonadales bacterium]